MVQSQLSPRLVAALVAVGCIASGCSSHSTRGSEAGTRILRPDTIRKLPQNSAPNALSPQASLEVVRAERDQYWLNAQKEVYRSVLELTAQNEADGASSPRSGRLMRGNPARREIALTFDDGPHPDITPQLLEILRRENVPATFFVVGELAERHPDLILAEIADGHIVGNHTYDHVSLIKIPDPYVATEIEACGEVLQHITGQVPRFFRPPGGEFDPDVTRIARTLGYTMVLWTDDPGDYASPGSSVIERRTLADVNNGGILLLHDGISQTIQILPDLIHTLKGRGFRFITVAQMAAEKGETSPAPETASAAGAKSQAAPTEPPG